MDLRDTIKTAVFGALRDETAVPLLRVEAGELVALPIAFREAWRGVSAVGTEVMRTDPQVLTQAPRGYVTRGDLLLRGEDFYLVLEVEDVESPVLTIARVSDSVELGGGPPSPAAVSAQITWVLAKTGLSTGAAVKYRGAWYTLGDVQVLPTAQAAPMMPA